MTTRPDHTETRPTSPAAARRAVRTAAILAALAGLVAVGGVALGTTLGRENGDATPAGTVRAFLIDAAIERNSVVACRYLTPAARQRVEAATAADGSCPMALTSATLTLGGRSIIQESTIKGLDYRVEERGARALVTVRSGGAALTFALRRATGGELREFQAPPTHWRIDSGVDGLVDSA